MRTRGRKPAGAEIIVGRFGKQPEPPPELTPRQAEIWQNVVSTEAPGFFATAATCGLLADYCRRRDAADGVSKIIDQFDLKWLKAVDGVKRFQSLLLLRDLESRGAAALAVKLRVTNQSRYTPRGSASAARNAPHGPRPWEL